MVDLLSTDLALEVTAVEFIAAVPAVVVVVATPVRRDTLAVVAAHLRLGTCAVRTLTNILVLV